MRHLLRPLSPLLLFVIICTSCRKEWRNEIAPGNKLFVSATPVGSYSKEVLQGFAIKAGFGVFAPLAKYDVNFYKLVYKTTFKGKQIQASGLVAIPKNTPTIPSLLSAQHGTIFRSLEAPSNFPLTFSGFELFASAGFVALIPDFIGYGVSQNIPHPYYDQESSGLSAVP